MNIINKNYPYLKTHKLRSHLSPIHLNNLAGCSFKEVYFKINLQWKHIARNFLSGLNYLRSIT